ncbi:sugar transporter [Labrenzia sp. CE80]|uniref:sugar transporter n=1 Tax=Labrenzia sp. CE80 TaxID=1788986 RepID=UPI00129AE71A|nr:sugar transporter [Labrenzia sp. CE80]
MFQRLFAVVFLTAVLGAPFAGLFSLAGVTEASPAVSQQRSMCITAGVGCGSGHILLPAIGRM